MTGIFQKSVTSMTERSYSNNANKQIATEGAGEGVLKSQSRVTHNPGLSQLVSSATLSGHNIS